MASPAPLSLKSSAPQQVDPEVLQKLEQFPWAYCRPFVDLRSTQGKTTKATIAILDQELQKLEACKKAYKEFLSPENRQRDRNFVVIHTDPTYAPTPPTDKKTDVAVFLVGPTDHAADVSHYRMEIVLAVAKKNLFLA